MNTPIEKAIDGQDARPSALLELGQKIPVLLVKTVQSDLYGKLYKWLQDNGAPAEVIDAYNAAEMLQIYIGRMEAGKMAEFEYEDLPGSLVDAANLSIKFGGNFMDDGAGSWIIGESQIAGFGQKP